MPYLGAEKSAGKGYLESYNKLRHRIVPIVSAPQPSSGNPQVLTPTTSKIKPSSLVYWTRFLLAIVAGFANTFLHIGQTTLGDLALIAGIAVALGFYALSILIVRHVFHLGEIELKGKRRDITLGGGTFIVVWVMVSVVLNTLWGH